MNQRGLYTETDRASTIDAIQITGGQSANNLYDGMRFTGNTGRILLQHPIIAGNDATYALPPGYAKQPGAYGNLSLEQTAAARRAVFRSPAARSAASSGSSRRPTTMSASRGRSPGRSSTPTPTGPRKTSISRRGRGPASPSAAALTDRNFTNASEIAGVLTFLKQGRRPTSTKPADF